MKDIIDIGFGSMIGMTSEEIPGKIAHYVVDNFDDDWMKLKLSNGVISITTELVYKVLWVPLGSEDINRMNRLGSEYVTTLERHSQLSRKNPTPKKVYDKIHESRMGGILFKLNFLVLFSNAMGLFEKSRQYDSRDDDIFERELDSKMDKLDQKVTLLKLIVEYLEFEFSNNLLDFGYAIEDNSIHHESQYGNVFSEMDYSLNFNDMSGNYNVGECSHGVEELYKDFINETNEENGEDSSEEEMIKEVNQKIIEANISSEEEMIKEVNQKIIEANIVLQKSINDDVQNKELNCIDEDFQKVRERFSKVVQNEEQMFVKGTHEEEILIQDSIEVNVLKVIEADSMAEKSTHDDIGNKCRKNELIIINKYEDEFNVFNGKKETSFDFKMFDIPKLDDKEKSVVGGLEDCLMKWLFRQVVEPDNSVRSFGNLFRVSTSDMPKHRLDEPPSFSLGPEFDDFSIEKINQTNVKDESRVTFSKTESHYIKPDIKDTSIRVQPKHEPSIAWYLKSHFKVRGSALNTYANTLSQTEVLAADTLFIMDEETDPI
nr:hypothetical protein [Tanacetum cinerariifolium]